MTLYKICHQSGRVLFTTDNDVTARNREQFGWKVIEVDKSREQFEQFIQRKFGDLIDQRITKNGDGEYFSWDMQVAWLSWQASRAAIEIELPENKWHPCDCIDVVIAFDKDDVIESIRAAGIKVKE